jgi:hypothetical protein
MVTNALRVSLCSTLGVRKWVFELRARLRIKSVYKVFGFELAGRFTSEAF